MKSPRILQFTKMNGAGNDFVVADNRDKSFSLTKAQIARICDRHRGVGADGLLFVEPAEQGAAFRMRYYNADGGEAEMCGNGARCFARYAARLAPVGDAFAFETLAGLIAAQLLPCETVKIGMSEPQDYRPSIVVSLADGSSRIAHFLNTGVPHLVVPVEDFHDLDVRALGRELRMHPLFAPRGTNVNFLKRESQNHIAIRTYERGVEDETLACGTGVVASAIIHSAVEGVAPPIRVHVRGGDVLEVDFEGVPPAWRSVTLTGPAEFVFEGKLEIPSL